jgi:hypothetical protein
MESENVNGKTIAETNGLREMETLVKMEVGKRAKYLIYGISNENPPIQVTVLCALQVRLNGIIGNKNAI